MKYAKLINDMIRYAPRTVVVDDRQIGNPTPETLIELGYKPLIYTDPPETEEGYVAISSWAETEETIMPTWIIEQDSGEIDDSEALNIILGGSE